MDNLAEIKLWGERVGALAYDPETGVSTFEYAASWRETGIEIAPLHMPLSVRKYQFSQLAYATFRGLPAVFSDTLPDDFGNAVINAWLARNGRDASSFSPLERLLYTGARGIGAIEYQPSIDRPLESGQLLQLDSLTHMAQQILDERAKFKKALHQGSTDEAMRAILQVGTSAGGARAKAVIAVNEARTEIRSGQVDLDAGFEHYILKFDGVHERHNAEETFGDPKGYGRMEYAYYLMAKDAGIRISPSELLIEGERAHFMTQRFDRIGNSKLHYISLCAMDHTDFKQPGTYSYEQLLSVARQLRLPRADAIEIFRRMVFNVVARNHDDHSKNFGFLLAGPKSGWRLSPAFDIAYSYKPGSPWVNTHQLSLNGKRDDFSYDDLIAVSSLIGNFSKEANAIVERVVAVVKQWPFYAEKAGVFAGLKAEIQRNLRADSINR